MPGHRHGRNLSQPIPSKSNQPNELLGIRPKPHCNEPQGAQTTQKPILAPTSPRALRPNELVRAVALAVPHCATPTCDLPDRHAESLSPTRLITASYLGARGFAAQVVELGRRVTAHSKAERGVCMAHRLLSPYR